MAADAPDDGGAGGGDARGLRSLRGVLLAVGGASLVVALPYAALAREFVYDDVIVTAAARAGSLSALGDLFSPSDYFGPAGSAWFGEETWRPLKTFTVIVDRALWDLSPAGHHLTSAVLHSLAAVVVTWLAWLLPVAGDDRTEVGRRRRRSAALLAGLLFGLHPVHSEVLGIASYRPDLLVTVFGVAGLCMLLRSLDMGEGGLRRRVVGAALVGLALLSKEMAVTLPVLGVLLHHLYRGGILGRGVGHAVRVHLPNAVVTAAYLVLRLGPFRRADLESRYPWVGGDLVTHLQAMLGVFAREVRLLFLPHPLAAEHPVHPPAGADDLVLTVAGATALVLCVVGFLRGRSRPAVALACGWLPVALLPVLGIIPLPRPLAERYLVFAGVGVVLAVAAGLSRLVVPDRAGAPLRRRAAVPISVVLVLFGVLTAVRAPEFSTAVRFYRSACAEAPDSDMMLRNLALASRERGLELASLANQADQARGALEAQGRTAEAAAASEQVETVRDQAGGWLARAEWAGMRAVRAAGGMGGTPPRLGTRAAADLAQAWAGLATTYDAQGRTQQAMQAYSRSWFLDPTQWEPAYNVGVHLQQAGEPGSAAEWWRRALDAGSRPAARPLIALSRHEVGRALAAGNESAARAAMQRMERAMADHHPTDPILAAEAGGLYFHMLRRFNRQADYERARTLLNASLDLSREHGIPLSRERGVEIINRLNHLQQRGSPAPPGEDTDGAGDDAGEQGAENDGPPEDR